MPDGSARALDGGEQTDSGHGAEEYAGPARVLVDDHDVAVHATLSGHFEPISGDYHWSGRIGPDAALAELVRPNTTVRLAVGDGPAEQATLREQDPWGGFRVSGSGRPPFEVPHERP